MAVLKLKQLRQILDISKHQDFSGRPGLFLTGNISKQDIDKLQKDIQAGRSTVQKKFITDKILWFPKGKLVNNESLLKTLNDDRKNELFGISTS
jgi:hypothetical protein